MISTGTDIKPLEVLLFLRSVKSRVFFEQMKGRGTRTIADADLQAVTPGAVSKTHFVLVDAVGVCERAKSDDPPLERKRSFSFANLLEAVALGRHDEDTLSSLAGRLGRLATRLTPAEDAAIRETSGGRSARELAEALVRAIDPDATYNAARAATGQEEPPEEAVHAAAERLIREATAPYDVPELRDALKDAQRRDEQTIDSVSLDEVTQQGWDGHQAEKLVTSFRQYIEDHHAEIAALELLYRSPRHAALSLKDLKALAAAIQRPPLGLSSDALWQAYAQLDGSRVRGASARHLLTDLVSLVRYTLERDRQPTAVLEPYAEAVQRRFTAWLAEQERLRGPPFSAEQRRWLELIRDHVTASLTIEPEDFDDVPFVQHGGLGRAAQLFGNELPTLLRQINEEVAA